MNPPTRRPPKKRTKTVRVTCHAPHPDPRHTGRACGTDLGDIIGPVRFIGTATRRATETDGRQRIQCPRRDCRMWNIFDLVPE